MNDNKNDEASFPFHIYRCDGGCFHVRWGNVVLLFSPWQLAFITKACQQALQQMEQELKEEVREVIDAPHKLIM